MKLPERSDSGQQSSRLPRAACPTCGRNVALRRGGELREHHYGSTPDSVGPAGELCPASGYTVAYVNERIALEIAAVRGIGRRS